MRIVLTGGAGFIGSHICDAYVSEGHDVLVYDDLSTGRRQNVPDSVEFVKGDICDSAFGEVVERFKPDVVNHHAAQISVVRSVSDPAGDARVNVAGLANVVHSAARARARRVIFSSSGGAIYGEPPKLPADETTPVAPTAPYGLSKYCGELYLDYYARTAGISTTILRYGNVYGPRQDPYGEAGVVAIFTQAMLEGRTPTIFGDGTQTRDFVFVGDVARANVAALGAPQGTCVNIGTGRPTSVNEIFDGLKSLCGSAGDARRGPERPGEVKNIHLECSRARETLGWTATTDLADGLAETARYFRDVRS